MYLNSSLFYYKFLRAQLSNYYEDNTGNEKMHFKISGTLLANIK